MLEAGPVSCGWNLLVVGEYALEDVVPANGHCLHENKTYFNPKTLQNAIQYPRWSSCKTIGDLHDNDMSWLHYNHHPQFLCGWSEIPFHIVWSYIAIPNIQPWVLIHGVWESQLSWEDTSRRMI